MNIIVPSKIAIEGADLISNGIRNSIISNVINGVEIMLLNNLYNEIENVTASKGQSDVTILLRQGLDYLSKSPHEALGVPIGAKTTQIRKAYKKHALKYHPDKNPKTTPLFQVMNMACDKLSDPILREKEERALASKQPSVPKPSQAPPPTTNPNQVPPTTQHPYTGFVPQSHGSGANAFNQKSTTNNNTTNTTSPRPNPTTGYPSNPAQFPPNFKPKYDPKTNRWNVDAEWAKYAQQQPTGNGNPNNNNNNYNNSQNKQQAEQNYRNQEANKRKQYYEEILREQFNKAESERKAKEYASMREMAAKQRAKYEEDLKTKYQNKDNTADNVYTNRNINKPTPPPLNENNHSYASYNPSSNIPNTSSTNNSNSSINNSNISNSNNNPLNFAYANNSNNNSSGNLKGMGGMKPIPNPAPITRIPRPYGLRCVFIGTNAAELEWVTSKYHRNTLLAELSWRNKALGAKAWESANKLISSGKCRKKNLTPGADYEFRVRAVEELAGGLLGYRSDWSDSISITLMADKTTNASTSDFHSASTHNLHKQGSYYGSKPNIIPSNDKTNENNATETKTTTNTTTQPPIAATKIHKFERFNASSLNNDTNTTSSSIGVNQKSSTEDRQSYPPNNKKIPIDAAQQTLPATTTNSNYNTNTTNKNTANSNYINVNYDNNIIYEMSKVKVDNNHVTKRFPPSNNNNNNNTLSSSAKFAWGKDITSELANSKTANDQQTTTNNQNKINNVNDNLQKKINKKEGSLDDLEVDEEISDNDEDIDDDIINSNSSNINTNLPTNIDISIKEKDNTNVNNIQIKEQKPITPASIGIKQTEYDDFIIEEDDEYDKEDDGFEEEIIEKIYKLSPPAAKVKGLDYIYAHPVRAEPFIKSNIVGYLLPGMNVISNADCGSWLKVCIHKQPNRNPKNGTRSMTTLPSSSSTTNTNAQEVGEDGGMSGSKWGWSVKADRQHEYLVLLDTKGHINTIINDSSNNHSHSINNSKSIDSLPTLNTKANIITTPSRTTRNTTTNATNTTTTTINNNNNNNNNKTATTATTFAGATAINTKDIPVKFEPMTPPPLINKKASYRSLANLSMHAIPHTLSPAAATTTTNNNISNTNSNTTTAGSKENQTTNPHSHHLHHKQTTITSAPSSYIHNNNEIIEEWIELYDVNSHVYYYNEVKNESKWEPPEWVEECDPDSGVKYYVHLGDISRNDNSELHSTWTKPEKFARLLRN